MYWSLILKQLSKSEEKVRAVTHDRDALEKELVESRRLNDETVKERDRLELDNNQLRKNLEDMKKK